MYWKSKLHLAATSPTSVEAPLNGICLSTLHAAELVLLVGGCYEGLAFAYLATASHSRHHFDSIGRYPEDQLHEENEAAYNVGQCVETALGDFLRFLRILDASEVAIVVMALALQCACIYTEAKNAYLRAYCWKSSVLRA